MRLQLLLDYLIRPNQTDFIKRRSIIDNVFLAYESIEWAVESAQPMVMLLLDFEKTYDKVEWGFLEGRMDVLGFGPTWIRWIRSLYADFWCSVGIDEQQSEAPQFSKFICQGCLLLPFLYLL